MKKLFALLLVFALTVSLFAGLSPMRTAAFAEEEENYETGDASLDNPRNQDEIGEKELLVVSFGTSYNDNRRLTVGAIENTLEEAFPDFSVRRAFTSQIIIDHVLSRDGEVIDNVTQALERAVDNGVKTLVVQPTHLMHGFEYTDLAEEVAQERQLVQLLADKELALQMHKILHQNTKKSQDYLMAKNSLNLLKLRFLKMM